MAPGRKADRLQHAIRDGAQVSPRSRGTGFLYVRGSLIQKLEPPVLDLQAARLTVRDRYEIEPTALRFENWERMWLV
jgi:hypothetical protein